MSDTYYLICEKHREAIAITDNKGNNWLDPDEMRAFLDRHGYNRCEISFGPDYYDEYMVLSKNDNGEIELRGFDGRDYINRIISPDDTISDTNDDRP